MRDVFEEQFREFAATQLANGEGHSVVLDELGETVTMRSEATVCIHDLIHQ